MQAIETVYKGYRFRSRLEARWAVFFDALGEEWQYEVEGFELPSGRYLPDFYLPKRKTYVEVKPGPAPHPMPVYMAGRIATENYRPFGISGDAEGDGESAASRIVSLCGIHDLWFAEQCADKVLRDGTREAI